MLGAGRVRRKLQEALVMLEPIRDKRCAGNRPVQGHIPPGFVFQIAAADIGVHARETYLFEMTDCHGRRVRSLRPIYEQHPSGAGRSYAPECEEDPAECGLAEQDGTNEQCGQAM
ncbi:hypothetical protein XI00_06595 [Bradyrhizobium sp. CCBAU 21359]|nr:hypothetical protein [Bradyrhizobium sp. CCBAU 21359]